MRQILLDFEQTKQYFQDVLKQGSTVSQLVFKHLDYNEGSFSTHLSENANLERLNDFTCGGIVTDVKNQGISSADRGGTAGEFMASFIESYLDNNRDAVMIFDSKHAMAEISNEHIFQYNNEKYGNYNFESAREEMNQILKSVDHSQEWMILLCRGFEKRSGEIMLKSLKSVISHVHFIIVRAYNGQGYLLWKRAKRFSTPGKSESAWYNPETGEIRHPDFTEGKPCAPHWDLIPGDSRFRYRLYSDNRWDFK